jgi:hypothetical protein
LRILKAILKELNKQVNLPPIGKENNNLSSPWSLNLSSKLNLNLAKIEKIIRALIFVHLQLFLASKIIQ